MVGVSAGVVCMCITSESSHTCAFLCIIPRQSDSIFIYFSTLYFVFVGGKKKSVARVKSGVVVIVGCCCRCRRRRYHFVICLVISHCCRCFCYTTIVFRSLQRLLSGVCLFVTFPQFF
ncbi:unnamed protein product [Ectocarpus sp. 6 AP-2014]